jgi:hypothetical protein
MQKLHAATGPNRATGTELLFFICTTSTPAPYAIIGKLAPNGIMPCKSLKGRSVRATTCPGFRCILTHIVGASLNLAVVNLA